LRHTERDERDVVSRGIVDDGQLHAVRSHLSATGKSLRSNGL
jgi:hypothetical protein